MKRENFNILLLIAILIPAYAASQTVVVDGEIRPRIEVRDGYQKPLSEKTDAGVFGIQRTRLNLAFNSGVFNSMITFQDARVFGQTPVASATATSGIFEAWAEMWIIPGGSFKIGRQALKYDDGRLFSAAAWSNTGTAHDVALFKYCVNDFQAHLGLAYNNNAAISSETYYTPQVQYRYMGYLWLTKDILDGLNLSLIAVDEGVQDTTGTKAGANYLKTNMYHAYTYGGNLKFQKETFPLSALFTGYFQSGKGSTGADLSGKMLCGRLDYKLIPALTLTAGTDYVSGDNTSDNKQTNFKKLYGAEHNFYGYMDYWDVAPTLGLFDYYGGLTAKVNKNFNVEATYHHFNLEHTGFTSVTNADKTKTKVAYGKNIGAEFDVLLNYKVNSWVAMQCGYCRYFQDDNELIAKGLVSTSQTKDASNATLTSVNITKTRAPQWAYVMFTIKPAFLNTATAK